MGGRRERREIVFREAGEADVVVPLVTPYLELSARLDHGGRTWVYSAQEGERPIFRPADETETEDRA